MTFYKPVAQIIPGLQSVAVMGRAIQMVPKEGEWWGKKKKGKKRKGKLVRGFTEIMVGTALIKPTATMVNAL